MRASKQKLTVKQLRFVEAYQANGGNATQAAITAGYSKKTAYSIGQENLNKPVIQAFIEKESNQVLERYRITLDNVIRELACLGFSNMGDYMTVNADGSAMVTDLSNLAPEQAAAIQEITVEEFMDGHDDEARKVQRFKLKLHDKRGPLVDLGKSFGAMRGQLVITGRDGGPMHQVTVHTTPEEAARIYRERMS